jgi:hypothetical protein
VARQNESPIADPHRGRAQFAEHLLRVLAGRTLDQLGWITAGPLTLFVPVAAGVGGTDDYLVRLGFEYYAEWPPTVQFINPQTRAFDTARDLYWLPRVEGDGGFAVHPQYTNPNYTGQLVCCSFTAEFYRMLHPVNVEHLWDRQRHTFLATISRIQQALRSPYYKGRFQPLKPQD